MTNEQKYKTPEERDNAFSEWCFNRDCKTCKLKAHNIDGDAGCRFYWLALEADEEKPEPCPFCGEKHLFVDINGNNFWCVSCKSCLYKSQHNSSKEKAIAAHNRVARAVMAAKESEVKG